MSPWDAWMGSMPCCSSRARFSKRLRAVVIATSLVKNPTRGSLFQFKRNPCLLRYIQQVTHHRFQQRNTFFASDRFGFSFRIAGNQRAVCSGRGLAVAKDFDPFVPLLDRVLIDRTIDPPLAFGFLANRCSG